MDAAERRKSWTWGVARGFDEMEEADLDFWLAATPEQRIAAISDLHRELASLRGEDGDQPRLQRSAFGSRPRRR